MGLKNYFVEQKLNNQNTAKKRFEVGNGVGKRKIGYYKRGLHYVINY